MNKIYSSRTGTHSNNSKSPNTESNDEGDAAATDDVQRWMDKHPDNIYSFLQNFPHKTWSELGDIFPLF